MTQTTDAALVERLRAVSKQMREQNPGRDGFNPVMPHEHTLDQAADTIEAQARRIEALEKELKLIADAEFVDVMCDPGWAIRIAHAALEPTP